MDIFFDMCLEYDLPIPRVWSLFPGGEWTQLENTVRDIGRGL